MAHHHLTHEEAVALAHKRVEKYGGQTLKAQLRRGFTAKFERQIEEAAPGLRERSPEDFQRRVEAAERLHMTQLARRSAAARRSSRAAAPGAPPRDKCDKCHDQRLWLT